MSTLTMAKPLNRLAVMTDYLIKRDEHDRTKRRHYSETLGEYYLIRRDGSLLFDSGAEYTRAELDKVRELSDDTKKQIHNIKQVFKGAELL